MLGNYFRGQKAKTGSFLVASTKGSPALVIVLLRISVRICVKGRTLCGIRQSVCLYVPSVVVFLSVSNIRWIKFFTRPPLPPNFIVYSYDFLLRVFETKRFFGSLIKSHFDKVQNTKYRYGIFKQFWGLTTDYSKHANYPFSQLINMPWRCIGKSRHRFTHS
jgi:hypothetical protein